MKKTSLLLASVFFGVLLASAVAVLSAKPGKGQTTVVTLVGAGAVGVIVTGVGGPGAEGPG